MSYDVFLYKLKPGVTVQQFRAAVEELERDADREGTATEAARMAGEDADDLLSPYLDDEITEDGMRQLVTKPYLEAFVPQSDRSPALETFLADPEPAEVPDDLEGELSLELMELEQTFQGSNLLMCTASFGTDLEAEIAPIWHFVRRLQPLGFAALDPQAGAVVDPDEDAELIRQSVAAAKEFFRDVLSGLSSGEHKPEFYQSVRTADEFARAGRPDDALVNYLYAWDLLTEDERASDYGMVVATCIGELYLVDGRFEEAARFLRPVMEADAPPTPALRMMAGVALYALGREEEALPHLREAWREGGDELFDGIDPEITRAARGE